MQLKVSVVVADGFHGNAVILCVDIREALQQVKPGACPECFPNRNRDSHVVIDDMKFQSRSIAHVQYLVFVIRISVPQQAQQVSVENGLYKQMLSGSQRNKGAACLKAGKNQVYIGILGYPVLTLSVVNHLAQVEVKRVGSCLFGKKTVDTAGCSNESDRKVGDKGYSHYGRGTGSKGGVKIAALLNVAKTGQDVTILGSDRGGIKQQNEYLCCRYF